MTRASGLMKSLGLEHPIVQAPMAGGGDTPRLVAAVSEAGALGSLGAAYLPPPQIPESAQGSEAGGHRGSFAGDFESSMVGTIALVPQIADAVRIPVIASGGIMDGRGIAAALALGAGAVQMGTAFLTTEEAGVPECYKQALLGARDDATRVTRAF